MNKPKEPAIKKSVTKTIICIFLFLPIWFLVYAFFHEAAHALLAIAYGGTIESFVFWNLDAHVRASGTEFTPFAAALNRASGELFTTFLAAVAIGFYRPKVKFAGYHLCYILGIISITGSNLGGWVVIPIRSLFTVLPLEDVIFFLDMTGFHPAIVAVTAFLLTSAFVCFAYAKGVFSRGIAEVGFLWRAEDSSTYVSENEVAGFKLKPGMVSLGLVLAAIITLITAFFIPYEQSNIFSVSTSFADVREEKYIEYTVIIEEAGMRYMNVDVQGQGFVTGFRMVDGYGDLILSFSGKYMSSGIITDMNEGVHTVSFVFLTDFESVMDFYVETGVYDHVEPKTIQNVYELFNRCNDDFSATVSFRLR